MIEFLQKYLSFSSNLIYNSILLTGIIIGIFRYEKIIFISKVLLFLLLLTLVVELSAFYCALKYHNNAFIYNPFRIIRSFIMCYVFYKETKLKVYWFIFGCVFLFAIVNGIFFEPFFSQPNYHLHMIIALIYIIWFFIYLTEYFKKINYASLLQFPVFWIGTGWLIFSIVSIVSFGFSSFIHSGKWNNFIITCKQYSNYLLYASFIPAFLCSQKSLDDFTASSK